MKDILIEIVVDDVIIGYSHGNIVPAIGQKLFFQKKNIMTRYEVVDVHYLFIETTLLKIDVIAK